MSPLNFPSTVKNISVKFIGQAPGLEIKTPAICLIAKPIFHVEMKVVEKV